MTCQYWTGARHCGATQTRPYAIGRRCADHTPAQLAGLPEPHELHGTVSSARSTERGCEINGQSTNRQKPADTDTGLDFAKKLGRLLDVPLVTCPPSTGAEEFHYPTGDRDSLTSADNQNQLSRFEPGWAIMARMGGPVAVVDVDPKNSGDIEKVRKLLDGLGVRIFAEIETPSGGRHFYIAGHPDLPSCSNLKELPGVDILSHGRIVFLPGARRPRYDGAGYRIVYDNLEALADGGNPDGAGTFADWVAKQQGNADQFETSPPWAGGEPDARRARYLAKMLRHIHQDLSDMGRNSGRNMAHL